MINIFNFNIDINKRIIIVLDNYIRNLFLFLFILYFILFFVINIILQFLLNMVELIIMILLVLNIIINIHYYIYLIIFIQLVWLLYKNKLEYLILCLIHEIMCIKLVFIFFLLGYYNFYNEEILGNGFLFKLMNNFYECMIIRYLIINFMLVIYLKYSIYLSITMHQSCHLLPLILIIL